MKNFRSVQEGGDDGKRVVVLNSALVTGMEDIDPEDRGKLQLCGVEKADFHFRQFRCLDECWSAVGPGFFLEHGTCDKY
jgi:hypothetical protein